MTAPERGRCTRAVLNVNLAAFHAGFQAWLLEENQKALQVYRGLCAEIFEYIIEETPQYSGEAVSNWTLNAKVALLSMQSGIRSEWRARNAGGVRNTHTKFWGGNPNMEAIELARAHLRTGLGTVKSLKDTVYIANATQFDDGVKTVGDLEDPQPGWLRAVNLPGHMIQRSVGYNLTRYAVMSQEESTRLARKWS